MTGVILGIDTSCYTTSCAAVTTEGRLLTSERMLLPVRPGERGLRQSDGVFAHIKQFPVVLERAYDKIAGLPVCAVCVSEKPADGEASYMPVFQTGLSFAKCLAVAYGVPLIKTTHQRGHFEAAQIGIEPLMEPYTALHLSGGTTDFVRVSLDGSIECFYTSLDLHAGQLFDRVGVRMGLPFPAGRHLEKIAVNVKPLGRYAAIAKENGICLSGVEAAAMRDMDEGGISCPQIAAELYDVLARLIVKAIIRFGIAPASMLITGGVASSMLLRERLHERMEKARLPFTVHFGNPDFCADNAAGVAMIGLKEWRKKYDSQSFKRENDVGRAAEAAGGRG